jgi:hypothetical protein
MWVAARVGGALTGARFGLHSGAVLVGLVGLRLHQPFVSAFTRMPSRLSGLVPAPSFTVNSSRILHGIHDIRESAAPTN